MRDPSWPGPGSAGLAGGAGGAARGDRGDQLVPSPVADVVGAVDDGARRPGVARDGGSTGAVDRSAGGRSREVHRGLGPGGSVPRNGDAGAAGRRRTGAVGPPPTATQNVSEMHDSDVNPPPGGNVVRAAVQPGDGLGRDGRGGRGGRGRQAGAGGRHGGGRARPIQAAVRGGRAARRPRRSTRPTRSPWPPRLPQSACRATCLPRPAPIGRGPTDRAA